MTINRWTDADLDAVALVEAHERGDREGWHALLEHSDHEAVIESLADLLGRAARMVDVSRGTAPGAGVLDLVRRVALRTAP